MLSSTPPSQTNIFATLSSIPVLSSTPPPPPLKLTYLQHCPVYLVNLMFSPHSLQIFHFCNSEQRADETIAFDAVCLGPKFNMTFDKEIWLSNTSVAPGNVFRFSLDPTSGKCERSSEPADPASVEFPTIHPYRHGKSTRYSYLMASDRPGCSMPYRDVVKVTIIYRSSIVGSYEVKDVQKLLCACHVVCYYINITCTHICTYLLTGLRLVELVV